MCVYIYIYSIVQYMIVGDFEFIEARGPSFYVIPYIVVYVVINCRCAVVYCAFVLTLILSEINTVNTVNTDRTYC